jgi:hypothetical protein
LAAIKTGVTDFGSSRLKRIHEIGVGCTSTGKLVIKAIVATQSGKQEQWYEVKNIREQYLGTSRVSVSRGAVSRYWQFELVNCDGADFTLSDIDIAPIELTRR